MNGYIKFNAWCKHLPLTSDNMKIFVNAGDHRLKQRYKSLCLNATPMNKYGKLPDFARESQGMSRAIEAFFRDVEADMIVQNDEIKEHQEPCVNTHLGLFCITDIAKVCGIDVFSDGLWLLSRGDGVSSLYHCDNFFKIRL